jgi:hypothetical protein
MSTCYSRIAGLSTTETDPMLSSFHLVPQLGQRSRFREGLETAATE